MRISVFAVLALASSCRESTGLEPLEGTFHLTGMCDSSVVGTVRLDGHGAAERVWLYGDGTRFVTRGSYHVAGDTIYFALDDAGYIWRPRGPLVKNGFLIRYPNPADGPDIVETYLR